jgi:hypothetical protein
MILWSSRELERALAGGALDAWTKVKYLMVPAVLGSLSVPFYVFRPIYGTRAPALNTLFSLIFVLVTVYIVYRGLKRCFTANNEIDGKAFFERMAILAIPIMIRIIAVSIPASIALLIIVGRFKDQVPMLSRVTPIIFSSFGPIITFATYVMLVNSIRRLGKLLETK